MDTAAQIEDGHIATVERLVSRGLARSVRHLAVERVPSPRRNRCYFRHSVSIGGSDEIVVFSKLGDAFKINDRLEVFLSGVASDAFAVPKFFGCAESGKSKVAVWSYAAGERVKRFHQLARADLCRVVRAVGAMNALTEEANRQVPNIRLRDVDVVGADRLKPALEEFDNAASRLLLPMVEQYELMVEQTRRRLGDIKQRYFSHQDIVARNILFPAPDRPPIFIDWENASLAVPGSCLRHFCLLDLPLQKEVAAHYVAFMAEEGHRLNPDDVLFVMGAAQIQASLRQGIKRRKIRLVRWALGAVKTYLQ